MLMFGGIFIRRRISFSVENLLILVKMPCQNNNYSFIISIFANKSSNRDMLNQTVKSPSSKEVAVDLLNIKNSMIDDADKIITFLAIRRN